MVLVVILMSLSTPFEIIYFTWFGIMVEGTRKASLGGGILGLGGGTGLGLIDQFSSNCLIILIRNINFYYSFLL